MFKKYNDIVSYNIDSSNYEDARSLLGAIKNAAENNPDKVIKVGLPGNCSLVATPINHLEDNVDIDTMLRNGPMASYLKERDAFLDEYVRVFNHIAFTAMTGVTECYRMADGQYDMKSRNLVKAVDILNKAIPILDTFEKERKEMQFDYEEILSLENTTK